MGALVWLGYSCAGWVLCMCIYAVRTRNKKSSHSSLPVVTWMRALFGRALAAATGGASKSKREDVVDVEGGGASSLGGSFYDAIAYDTPYEPSAQSQTSSPTFGLGMGAMQGTAAYPYQQQQQQMQQMPYGGNGIGYGDAQQQQYHHHHHQHQQHHQQQQRAFVPVPGAPVVPQPVPLHVYSQSPPVALPSYPKHKHENINAANTGYTEYNANVALTPPARHMMPMGQGQGQGVGGLPRPHAHALQQQVPVPSHSQPAQQRAAAAAAVEVGGDGPAPPTGLPTADAANLNMNTHAAAADMGGYTGTGAGAGGLRGTSALIVPAKMQPVASEGEGGGGSEGAEGGGGGGSFDKESGIDTVDNSAANGNAYVRRARTGAWAADSPSPSNGGLTSDQHTALCTPAPAPAMELPATLAIPFADLQLTKQIGGGAFGSVWKGNWQGTPVAVKVLNSACQQLNEQGVKAFDDEVHMLARIRHPHICLFMGACMTPPSRAIVTELVQRGSLWDCLRDNSAEFRMFMRASFPAANNTCPKAHWPSYAIKKIVDGVLKGLAYLHAQQPHPIIHRDLKSANVLLTDSFEVKICDFGLARLRDVSNVMTANVGTVHWMAPEVLAGASYSESADVFSLGILTWELFTGLCPYEGRNQVEIAVGVAQKGLRPELPPYLSPALVDFFGNCWAPQPVMRLSAQSLLQMSAEAFQC